MTCQHEETVLDGKKSLCKALNAWTNCREVGHCVAETLGRLDVQLELELEEA